jgi:hypothetical protein
LKEDAQVLGASASVCGAPRPGTRLLGPWPLRVAPLNPIEGVHFHVSFLHSEKGSTHIDSWRPRTPFRCPADMIHPFYAHLFKPIFVSRNICGTSMKFYVCRSQIPMQSLIHASIHAPMKSSMRQSSQPSANHASAQMTILDGIQAPTAPALLQPASCCRSAPRFRPVLLAAVRMRADNAVFSRRQLRPHLSSRDYATDCGCAEGDKKCRGHGTA